MNRSFLGLLAASAMLTVDSAAGSNGHHFGRTSYGGGSMHHAKYTKPGTPRSIDRKAKRRAVKAGRRAARKNR